MLQEFELSDDRSDSRVLDDTVIQTAEEEEQEEGKRGSIQTKWRLTAVSIMRQRTLAKGYMYKDN